MFPVGHSIGSYKVVRKLGQGGMGAVFEVVHQELSRRAAIKVLHPEYAKDEHSIQRFFNEARAVNIIRHPGLVGVFESGRLEDGCAFIVMEFLDGDLLSSRLARATPLPLREVLHLGRQIASALDVAHRKGIVHRDLKPDNVMIVHDPEAADGERVKIFDFGLAKLRSTSLAEPTGPTALRTQPGMIMGTPTHMAPEQCRGASNIDGKADVYSLGVMLFEALVGHPPFFADNVGELMTMHLRDAPPGLRKLDPSIPKDLADLVHSMLAKEAGDRPDMGQVCAQLVAQAAQRPRRTNESEPEVMPSVVADYLSERDRSRAGRTTGGSKVPPPGQTRVDSQPESRQFLWAIIAAVMLVGISGALLFDFRLPGGRTAAPDFDPAPRSARAPLPAPRSLASVAPVASPPTTAPATAPTTAPATLPATPMPNLEPSLSGLPPGQRLRWQLESRPQGAAILRLEDGRVLGRTPWTYEEKAQAGMLKLTLKHDGFADAGVILDLTSPSKQTVVLLAAEEAMNPTPQR